MEKQIIRVQAHPDTKAVITISANNPEYGTVAVSTSTISTNDRGFLVESTRFAFVRGQVSVLEKMFKSAGQIVPGRIARFESHNPFYVAGHAGATKTQTPKTNPSTGEVVLKNGKEVYFQDVYSLDPKTEDAWVEDPLATTSEEAVVDNADEAQGNL